jgi:ATP-dependent protease HslVU (ClpYQ) peptidase subunit
MTTIAYKDGILAADTQLTLGDNIRAISSPKIMQLNNDTVLAAAGGTGEILKAKAFFTRNDWWDKLDESPTFKKDDDDDGGFEALLWFKGNLYMCSGNCYPEPLVDGYYAIGNGWILALAAMKLGQSAPEAILFAGEHNIYTNKIVQTLNVKELQTKKTRRSRN